MNLHLQNRLRTYGLALSVIPLLIVVCTTFYLSNKKLAVFNQEINTIAINDLDHIVQGVYAMCKAHQEVIQEMVDHSLNMAREVLSHSGEAGFSDETVQWRAVNQFTKSTQSIQLPKFIFGEKWLGKTTSMNEPSPMVDKVKEIAGGTCTIFQRMNNAGDMLRISTNVINKEGKRAIGTFIPKINPDGNPNPVVSQVLQGKTFRGRAFVVDQWYITAYKPIFDSDKRVIGMLYVGIPQESVKSLRQAIIDTKVGKTGYVYVLDSQGHYVISKNGEQDGKNIFEIKDANGGYPIKEICKKALSLKTGQTTEQNYYWQNPEDPNPRLKIARLAYFKDWDWIIGAGAYSDEFNQSKAHIDSISRSNLSIMITVITVTIVATILVWRFVAIGIVHPLQKAVDFAAAMAKGDFSQKLDLVQKDEIGTLVNELNHMSESLRKMLKNIADGVKKLTSSSNELSAVSQQMTSGSEQSAGKAQSVARATDHMSSNLQSIASSSQEASTKVQLVATATEQIHSTVGELARTTEKGRSIADDVVNQSKTVSKRVNELGSSVDQIGKVTETIAEISEQTNLLALNATIEAARAGEAGKGFAVVANEIKDLAKQTAESTKEIDNNISTIQSKTRDTVGKIDQISLIIHDLSEIVNTIAAAMEEQSTVSKEIATNVQQASQRIENLNKNVTDSSNVSVTITQDIEEVYQSAQEIASGSTQISSSAKELSTFAEDLNKMAAEFTF